MAMLQEGKGTGAYAWGGEKAMQYREGGDLCWEVANGQRWEERDGVMFRDGSHTHSRVNTSTAQQWLESIMSE